MLLVLGMVSAFAQTKAYTGTDGDGAKITIENAAKGETYKVVKVFDATVTGTAGGSIAYQYTGDLPSALAAYFEKDTAGNVGLKRINDSEGRAPGAEGYIDTRYELTATDFAALKTWAEGQSATASEVSDGSVLEFTNLPYGYYIVVSTQGATVTVTSTNPNATVVDKNSNNPSAHKSSDKDFSVGDTITYTALFDAPNYLGDPTSTDGAKQIVSYTIQDTLPDFLENVAITSVTVKQPNGKNDAGDTVYADTVLSGTWAFDDNGKITVPWATKTSDDPLAYKSNYKANSKIEVVYTAKLTKNAEVGADNVNTVELIPNVDNGNGPEPYETEDEWKDTSVVTTHAAALQKIDENGDNLPGAKFRFKGLTVITDESTPGVYTVTSYDPASTADWGTEMSCDDDGKLVIIGINKSLHLTGEETEAPNGYNKLEGTFTLDTVTMSSSTTTTWHTEKHWYDADGNEVDSQVDGGSSVEEKINYASVTEIPTASIKQVENRKGTELPSTGGIGTTIFYIGGSILVLAAAILLVTKRRMGSND